MCAITHIVFANSKRSLETQTPLFPLQQVGKIFRRRFRCPINLSNSSRCRAVSLLLWTVRARGKQLSSSKTLAPRPQGSEIRGSAFDCSRPKAKQILGSQSQGELRRQIYGAAYRLDLVEAGFTQFREDGSRRGVSQFTSRLWHTPCIVSWSVAMDCLSHNRLRLPGKESLL
ncbi:hypothetical protein Fuma_06160 [Fuerstiella marisgermanici]|uniref:Uncharacterized protein n=1 Tax=Fuerstiella marisgermanici TaxID=1891926 RepID=A0A1P8WR07_9PLAN|nr:hypothetical protein Fuma_06160 [Fuerstiella marisgermanici]